MKLLTHWYLRMQVTWQNEATTHWYLRMHVAWQNEAIDPLVSQDTGGMAEYSLTHLVSQDDFTAIQTRKDDLTAIQTHSLCAPRAAGVRNICVGFVDVTRIWRLAHMSRKCYAQNLRIRCASCSPRIMQMLRAPAQQGM
jgi:hypothetical protein